MSGIDWKHFRWIESVIIPVTSALMRAAWITPVIRFGLNSFFVSPQGVEFPGWLVLMLLLGGSLAEVLLQDHPDGQTINVGVGLLVIAAVAASLFHLDVIHLGAWLKRFLADLTSFSDAIPASLVVIVTAALLWGRGMAASWNSYRELFRGFLVGVVVLGFLMLVTDASSWERIGMSIWGTLGAFLVSALMSLAMMGAYEVLSVERFSSGRSLTLSRHWLMAAGSVMLAVVVLGWVTAQVLTPGAVGGLLELLSPIWILLRTILSYIILGIAYVIFWAIGPLLDLLKVQESGRWEQATEGLRETLENELEFPEPTPAEPNMALQMILRVALLVVIIGGIALLFYLLYRRRRQRKAIVVADEREFVFSGELLNRQIRDMLGRVRRAPSPLPFLDVTGEDPRYVIRRLYQRWLARMRDLGHARSPALTPLSYARVLSDLVGSERKALGTLTDAYLVARYAPDPPTQEQVDAARRALESLEARLASGL